MGPKSNRTGVLIKMREFGRREKKSHGDGGRNWSDSVTRQGTLPPPEAGRDRESSQGPPGEHSLLTP